MRVLQIHTRYREGGGEDAVVDAEAGELRQSGHEVRQVSANNPTGAPQAAAALVFAPWNPMMVARLRRAIDDFRPDVAHVHNTWFAMSPAVIGALKGAGIPVTMTLHNYRLVCANAMLFRDGRPCEDCVGASPWQAVRHACYRGSRPLSVVAAATIALHQRVGTWDDIDTLIALTEFQRDMMIRGGIQADRIVIKANAVADPGPRPVAPSQSETVLYAGRLSAEKGVDLLIDAWLEARPSGLELLIVGEGPLQLKVEDAAKDATSIRYAGSIPHDEVISLMLTSRALVLPSRLYEASPLAMVEAFSSGLPVVASDLGGVGETVARLGRDSLVDTADPTAWEKALGLLGDQTWIDEASVRARAVYDQAFSPAATAGLLENTLRAAIAKG